MGGGTGTGGPRKESYKDLNMPNPTIRERFISEYRVTNDNKSQQRVYCFDSPHFLNKEIELQATNGLGYQKPHKKNRENISKKELLEYFKEKDDKILENERLLEGDMLYCLLRDAEQRERDLYDIEKTSEKGNKYFLKELQKRILKIKKF